MGNVLFLAQQIVLPFDQLWPIGAVLLCVFLAGVVLRQQQLRFAALGILNISFFLILAVRFIVVLKTPYTNDQLTVAYEGNQGIPLLVFYRDGDLQVHTANQATLSYNAYEPQGAYEFRRMQLTESVLGTPITTEGVALQRTSGTTILTRELATGDLLIPETYRENARFQYQDATGTIDLQNSSLTALEIDLTHAQVALAIPDTQKSYAIKLILATMNTTLTLRIPRSASITMKDADQQFAMSNNPFTRVTETSWILKGTGNGPDIQLDAILKPNTLAIEYTN